MVFDFRGVSIYGQITIFHQPRFSRNKGIPLPQLPFGGPGRVLGRELSWPDFVESAD